MGTAVRPAKTFPGPWDAFADGDVFVDTVLAELEAMAKDGSRPMRSGPKPPLTGAKPRQAGMAIWCVNFCGMQRRPIGLLCGISFGTRYGLLARWTRLGLWRRLLGRLHRDWRRACGDAPGVVHMWKAPSLQDACSALIRSLASICPACLCVRI
jgi:hypothetical protein